MVKGATSACCRFIFTEAIWAFNLLPTRRDGGGVGTFGPSSWVNASHRRALLRAAWGRGAPRLPRLRLGRSPLLSELSYT